MSDLADQAREQSLDPFPDVALADVPAERLEAEICELAAHLAAAECRWLLLVAEFDRRMCWADWGCRSAVDWLSWRCGLSRGTAHEKLRVAHALGYLRATREAFARGALSYSQVRAITRTATCDTEDDLLEIATHTTAAELDRIVRGWRRYSTETEACGQAQAQYDARYVHTTWTTCGMLHIEAELPPEQGALILEALAAMQADLSATAREPAATSPVDESPAEDSSTGPATPADPGPRRADALVALAQAGLETADHDRTSDYLVLVHVDAATLAGTDGGTGRSHIDRGPALAPETVRRLCCEAAAQALITNSRGEPLDLGRKTRTVNRKQRRALYARDRGCRFPGCDNNRYLHAHHTKPWLAGGQTNLDNLILLCTYHHRLVHEGGWHIRADATGAVTFIRPDSTPLQSTRPHSDPTQIHTHNHNISIDPETIVPDWDGTKADLNYVLDTLLAA